MTRRVSVRSYSQPCPVCGANVGEPCTVTYTKNRRAHYTHADRKRAVERGSAE